MKKYKIKPERIFSHASTATLKTDNSPLFVELDSNYFEQKKNLYVLFPNDTTEFNKFLKEINLSFTIDEVSIITYNYIDGNFNITIGYGNGTTQHISLSNIDFFF
jgi:hypothetical protein